MCLLLKVYPQAFGGFSEIERVMNTANSVKAVQLCEAESYCLLSFTEEETEAWRG